MLQNLFLLRRTSDFPSLWLPLSIQSRPQSPRYPCPAERENEDLWEDAFELGISLAIDRACAVPPEVDKQ